MTVVAWPGCPHRDLAVARASQALLAAGFSATVDIVEVSISHETETDPAGFRGSPTVLIDGRDPFPAPDSTAAACRLYRTEAGLEGAPSVSQLQQTLRPARR